MTDEHMVTVRLSMDRLTALRDAINQMYEFAKSCEADCEKGNYHEFDEGMTDWREDITFAAEGLLDSITALDPRWRVSDEYGKWLPRSETKLEESK